MADELKLSQVIMFVVGLVVLGALAWGLGWMAHSLFDRGAAPPPTATVEPTTPLTAAHSPTPTPPPASPPPATLMQPPDGATSPATSTPAPTEERSVEAVTAEASDRGVYDVVRRACGLSRNYVLSLDDEIVRETWQLNGFVGENPAIFEGQEIQIPIHLCP